MKKTQPKTTKQTKSNAAELLECGRQMIRETPAAAPVQPTQPPAVPDWVTKTPRDFDYDLMLYDEYDGERQHIALTRAEYIAVKGHLAGMRGLVPVPAVAGPDDEPDVIWQTELQSVFDDLEIINLKMLGYRRRILAGATIEPGPLTTEWEGEEPGPESPRDDGWMNFNAYGLNICAAETSYAAIRERLTASTTAA